MPGSATEPLATLSPNSPLAAVAMRPSPTLPPEASLRSALVALDAQGADALAVVDPASRTPLGILTLRDVLRRVVLGGSALDQPVAAVMTGGVHCLFGDASVHQACVTMIRHRLNHLVVVDAEGRYLGVVSQAELYARPSARTGELVAAIAQARDVGHLAEVAGEVRRFCTQLLVEGLSAEALCQQISSLNDLIGLRVIDIVSARHELPYVPWCWMVFGSEGRLEQTLSTDQDNGLVFLADNAGHAAALRAVFLPFAQDVNAALDTCGFPLCKGRVMASNPELCLSLDEWKDRFAGWLQVAEPEAILGATIYFDLRALCGDERLVAELQQWLLARTPECHAFLRAMADSALNWQSPLAWWSGFRYDDNKEFPHTIDLKLHGVRPFVDAARIWALSRGVAATNTAERLRTLGPMLHQRPEDTAAFLGALAQVQRLRLTNQISASSGGENRIDPDRMNELDRQILKEVFRQVKQLQQLIEVEFLRAS